MRLQYNKNQDNPVLYIVESTYNKITKKKSNRVVENLGHLKDIKTKFNVDDPIQWGKNYLDDLNDKLKENKITVISKFSNTAKIEKNKSNSINAGSIFLQKIYSSLSLDNLSKEISKKHKFNFDFSDIFSTLIFSRILKPSSKRATSKYAKSILGHDEIDEHKIYRALDVISKESELIQSYLYKNSSNLVKRDISVLYFDCSNFYCETNITDELRQYGVSKENRPSPIIGIALFIDGNGIPLAVDIYPGNQNEQLSLKPIEERIMKDFENARFIVCTDAGLNSDINKKFHKQNFNDYVSTQPIKKLKKHLKEEVIDPNGWKILCSKKLYDISKLDPDEYYNTIFYKERWKNENGFEERLISTFSFKYRDFQRKNRQISITKAENKIKRKNISSKEKYIKETSITKDGELADKKLYSLNSTKINEDEKYDGFYAVTTSLNINIEEIININKNRWQIEECFRILKSDLKSRPIYLTNASRIKAHLLTCFLALFFIRILENNLEFKYNYSEIIETLRTFNLTSIGSGNYIPAFTRTDLTDDLHLAFKMDKNDKNNLRLDTEVMDKRKIKRIITFSKQK